MKSGISKSDSAIKVLQEYSSPRIEKPRNSEDVCTPTTDEVRGFIYDVIFVSKSFFCFQTYEDIFSLGRTAASTEKFDLPVPQPHPLPMPEYGGYFAPLTEYLPDSSQPISGFHR